MEKLIDLTQTVYTLCKDDPEVIGILKALGFDQIAQEGMLNTVGRFMTLGKGAVMKGLEMENVEQAFINNGYTILKKKE